MKENPDAIHQRLEKLLRDYSARVRALVESQRLAQYGIDPADVEQEVHIRLWQALERDRNGAFHASYIQRVVASTIIDAVRRARLRITEALPETDAERVEFWSQTAGPERTTDGKQDAKRIFACLDELPERRRVPLALHLQGFSLAEVAELSNVSVEAARKLVTRGLEDLKSRLRVLGYGEYDD